MQLKPITSQIAAETIEHMNISFSLTEADYFEYSLYANWQTPQKRYYRIIASATPLVTVLIIVLFFRDEPILHSRNIGLMVMGVFFTFIMPYWVKRKIKKTATQMISDPKTNALIMAQRNFQFSENELHVSTEKESSTTAWTTITSFAETENLLLLILLNGTSYVIPKRAFGEDYTSAKNTLDTWLSQARTAA